MRAGDAREGQSVIQVAANVLEGDPLPMVEVEAPAKVNLGLKILGRRSDGYHNLDTVFQAVSLFDTLVLIPGRAAPGGPSGTRFVAPDGLWLEIDSPWPTPCDESNLVVRAVRLFAAETGRAMPPLGIRLTKRIPPGGGLAGGSADSAAALLGLRVLFARDLPDSTLRLWGLRLGSDVPFCLVGGTARGRGRGEDMTPIVRKLGFWMTLVNPGAMVKTAQAFAAFDPGRHSRSGDLSGLVRALEDGRPQEFAESLENSFELCLDGILPEMRAMKKDLETVACAGSLLSGSGATVWGLFWDETQARNAAKTLGKKYPFVETVTPISTGVRVRKSLL